MEKWYLPITILPGIGLLILSTSNLIIALNKEVEELLKEAGRFEDLIHQKLKQMRLLTMSIAGFYISTALLVLSGIFSGLQNFQPITGKGWGFIILLVGVGFIFLSLVLLIVYAIKAVSIRGNHFETCLIEEKK